MSAGSIGSLCIILAIIGYFGYKYYKKIKTEEGVKELQKFFNRIRNAAEDAMLDYLQGIDISNITNITIMQRQVLEDLYDTVWNICIEELSKEVDESYAKIIRALLTRRTVEEFIEELYENSTKVQETVTSKYNEEVIISISYKE